MFIKRKTLSKGEIEFHVNPRNWTVGFSADYEMYYIHLLCFSIGYIPESSIGWRG
jgi:hypothetical protein